MARVSLQQAKGHWIATRASSSRCLPDVSPSLLLLPLEVNEDVAANFPEGSFHSQASWCELHICQFKFLSKKSRFVVKQIKYKAVKVRYYKDFTANSRVSDVISLKGHRNCNSHFLIKAKHVNLLWFESFLVSCAELPAMLLLVLYV